MGILRWCFAATVALLVGMGFGLFSGSIVLGACVVVVVLLMAAFVSWEERLLGLEARNRRSGAGVRGRIRRTVDLRTEGAAVSGATAAAPSAEMGEGAAGARPSCRR